MDMESKPEENRTEEEYLISNVLPYEIMFDILLRLPVKSLVRFRCVSKSWQTLVANPYFARMHLNHSKENKSLKVKLMVKDTHQKLSTLDYEDSDRVVKIDNLKCICIYGSCNGLLCTMSFDSLYIWNPTISVFKKVSWTGIQEKDLYRASYGFGYNSKVNDYMMVRVAPDRRHYDSNTVHVYSLRKDSWRKLSNIRYAVGYQRNGTLVNDNIHWVASAHATTSMKKLIAFDIEGENFREVPLPESVSSKEEIFIGVAEFEGQLCLVDYADYHPGARNSNGDIWVMKDYGFEESWTKLFRIVNPSEPLCITKNGLVLMRGRNLNLFSYDMETRNHSHREVEGLEVDSAISYVESLVGFSFDE